MRPRTWVLVLAGVFAVLQLANVTGRDTPDSKNYVSYALTLAGTGKREAAAETVDWVCAGKASAAERAQRVDVVRFHAPSPAGRVFAQCRAGELRRVERRLRAGGAQTDGHVVPFVAPRLRRIFEVRPGYPVFLVPFVTVFGVTWGVWLASVLVAGAGGVLVFLVLRTVSVPVPLALTGQALYYVLPVGTTAMRPMAEGLMLALTLTALWGCALVLTGRAGTEAARAEAARAEAARAPTARLGRPRLGTARVGTARVGTALVAGALVALFAVKHSQALFLGACLAGAAALVALWRRRRDGRSPGRGVAVIAAVGCGAVAGTLLLARLLRYPSEAESVQDLLTGHYAHPDRAHPWREFLHLEFDFWVEWLRRQLSAPLFPAALAAGACGARRRPAFGVFLLAAAATGILTQAGHPDITIFGDRLIVLAWLLPVVGVPLLLEPLVHRPVPVPPQGAPRAVGITR
ncbi:MAG: hypothetical protein JF597_40040 [Streptomyces sp.]|uniref:hypothetical protein n=1 Tax=Streptomyces sp. TaxID=1931 RepID=UPI0025FC5B50|nr:hypothetical protein [Streptomyces sp.]MBW8799551.1 hypothetical protein [Streptomyces sp.]